jgi:AcrR family transcriptional regulator
MNEKNYNSITVKEITDRAELNRATFYLHFSDKEDLLYQSTEDVLYEVFKGIEKQNVAFLTGYTGIPDEQKVLLFKRFGEHSDFFKVMLTKANVACMNRLHSTIYQWIYDYLSSVAKNKNTLIPIEVITQYHSAALIGLLIWWVNNNMPYEPEEMVDNLSKLINLTPRDTLYL